MYSPLGILYLAASAQQAGFSVEIVDLRGGVQSLPEARFYGFSCTTPEITEAKKLAKTVKGITIVGGAHPSLLPDDCKGHFDHIVRGEGEEVLPQILERGQDTGVLWFPDRIKDLDSIPFPAWDRLAHPFSDSLFPGERYGYGQRAMTIITSRGCPFSCSFCANIYRTPIIYRSVDNIAQELCELIKRGVRHFRFEDDNFTLHPQFNNLCVMLGGLNIHYKGHTRSNLLTEGQTWHLKQSGCEEFGLGIESADDKVLELNNKKETAKDHKKAIKILKKVGIRLKTYWMAGLPGETDETLEINKQFVIDTQPEKWTLSTFTPYPGSPIWKEPEKYGIKIIHYDWEKWWNFSNQFNHILEGQTQEEMWQRYLDFYEFLKGESWRK